MDQNDQTPLSPDEYPDVADQEELDDEEVSPWPGWYRAAVIFAGIVFTLSMLGPPLLRIVAFDDNDEPPTVEQRLRQNTALIFTAAIFERRSVDLAMNVTVDSLQDEIEALVADLDGREARALDGADITLTGVNCGGLDERSEECYEASITSAQQLPLMSVRFGISFVAGSPRIIDIARAGTAV